jgi:arylsulfatase A-like enzyme
MSFGAIDSSAGLGSLLLLLSVACLGSSCDSGGGGQAPAKQPNIVWLVPEDMNFEVGAFGDSLARTPHIDRLAQEGVRFRNVFATSGVCAASRASLITGMYATSIGAHHMRSSDGGYQPVPPPEVKTFTEGLRAAGYYTSNYAKLDYQFSGVLQGAPLTNWDEPDGLWQGRAPDQPFFAYITFLSTHESALFGDNSQTETDPSAIEVPPYYPDTPLVRADFARLYDNVHRMDQEVGDILEMLEDDGVLDDTIIFFFPDNGRGFPRDKRWVYDGGIQEPLIVRWPGQLEPGAQNDELLSFIDFAPTTLALAGVPVPDHMQGRVFLGPARQPAPEYVFAASDRMDEAPDRIRAVRDKRFKYIRNYQPETPYGQPIAFRNLLETMQEMFRLHDADMLEPPADWYFKQTKPLEELYDTEADPFELDSLAAEPEFEDVLLRMRAAHEAWLTETGDLGAVPETELAERYWPGGVQPVTPPPAIDPPGGGFVVAPEVSIRSEIEGASIAYTLDEGDEPSWKLYTGPLEGLGGRVRARAVRYGWAESEVTEALFTVGSR